MDNTRLAVILGLSPTGLYAVRELGRIGVPVLGIEKEISCGKFSRYLTSREKHWQISDNTQLLNRLLKLAEVEEMPPVLIPTSDYYIDFITQYSTQLKPHFIFQESYASGLATSIMDKVSFHKLCGEHNITTPTVWESKSRQDLLEITEKAVFPCILKPKLIHEARDFMKGKKVLLARSKVEFDEKINLIPEELSEWLVQEVIPGPESNIFLFAGYFDRSGNPSQSFTARKLRQYPSGFGSASFVQSEHCQEVHDISTEFLQALNFRGLCGTEFKYDPRDNKYKIIEINPRPTLWFNVSNCAGKEFVQTAYTDLTGQQISHQKPQLDGVRWRYALKDMYSQIFYLQHGRKFIFPPPEISKHLLSFTKRSWAVFDWRDPVPSIVEPVLFCRKLLERRSI